MVYLDQRWGYPIHVDIHVGGAPKDAVVQNGDLALVHMASDPEKSQTQIVKPNAKSLLCNLCIIDG